MSARYSAPVVLDRLRSAVLFVTTGVALFSCVGDGAGTVAGTVLVPVCGLDGPYDLHATYFGGYRDGRTLYVRVQNGGARPDFQDHLTVVFTDTDAIAARLATSTERDADGAPVVTLRVGPDHEPGTLVYASLNLPFSCGRRRAMRLGQNAGLPSVGGTMTLRAIDRGDGRGGVGWAGAPRITDVPAMHLELRDDRPIGSPAPEGLSPDTPVGEGVLEGGFRFDYDRSAVAQPFT